MEHVYEGRYEIGVFATDFLPDAETDMGEVPSVGRWISDALDLDRDPPRTIRVRLTVERLDA